MKLTEKQESILAILKENFADGAFAEEVVEKVEGASVQSVRETLSYLDTKGLCSKKKDIYEWKEKTKYTPVEVSAE